MYFSFFSREKTSKIFAFHLRFLTTCFHTLYLSRFHYFLSISCPIFPYSYFLLVLNGTTTILMDFYLKKNSYILLLLLHSMRFPFVFFLSLSCRQYKKKSSLFLTFHVCCHRKKKKQLQCTINGRMLNVLLATITKVSFCPRIVLTFVSLVRI